MWYEKSLSKTVLLIKNANKKISKKEYIKIAKEKDLLCPQVIINVRHQSFNEFVKEVRNKEVQRVVCK